MDCKQTLENLALLLDGELESERENEILEHLHDCWHCADVKENELKLKELIQSKMSYTLKTPDSLVGKIRDLIEA